MKKYLYIILALLVFAMPMEAQTKKSTTKKTTTTNKKSPAKKTTTTAKKTTATSKKSPVSIQGLKNERAKIQKNIKKQEQALRANRADVKKRLQNLMVLNTQINDSKKAIALIESDISHLNSNIGLLETQLETLTKQLEERKQKYVKSLRYMSRNHSAEDKLMFIFSAKSFGQMYRRMRFVKEYASFQRAQGEILKKKQAQVEEKRAQLEESKKQMNNLLYKGKQEHNTLESRQAELRLVVRLKPRRLVSAGLKNWHARKPRLKKKHVRTNVALMLHAQRKNA